ncbi:hypothetical protein CNY89_21830 [Amaricoccus sp. HAR-UPW-R2A-40]|nr:hypothetical protein CNY89_21830 [Amaricoccus sp. HAR-UPW-R2A-40]
MDLRAPRGSDGRSGRLVSRRLRPAGLAFAPDTPERIANLSEQSGGLAAFSLFGSRRRVNRNSKDVAKLFRKRLSEEDIRRISDRAGDVWPDFYTEAEW